MHELKVFVENLPASPPWYVTWAPIAIAVVALFLSIVSLCWSAKQHRDSSRPYVWILNWATLETIGQQQRYLDRPETFAVRVANLPAHIKQIVCEWYYMSDGQKNVFHSWHDSNMVRFPDVNAQSCYNIGEFQHRCDALDKGIVLKRDIKVEYSGLSRGKVYHYSSFSTYDRHVDAQWKVVSENAS